MNKPVSASRHPGGGGKHSNGHRDSLNERAVTFGSRRSLVGIVTEATSAERPSHDTAALLLNAGILHRVGPNRIYVQIARRLAHAGMPTMRFDFSGLGDSGVRHDKMQFGQAAVSETVEAMDVLRDSYGVKRFLLIGLCSGADLAFRTAAIDDRVLGLGLIDFYYQPTLGYYLSLYRGKLLNGTSWRRLMGGRSSFLQSVRERLARLGQAKQINDARTVPDKADTIDTFRALATRSTKVFFVYTAEGPAHYHYERSFRRRAKSLFDPADLRSEVIDQTDHVFTPLASQRRLVTSMQDWAEDVVNGTKASPSERRDAS